MIQHHIRPFRHSLIDRYLTRETYDTFCSEVSTLISQTRSHGFDNYDASVYELAGLNQRLLRYLITPAFLSFVRKQYDIPDTKYIDSAVHVHGPDSRSGWRHNDFNFGHFASTMGDGLSFSNNRVCDYRNGTMPIEGERLKLVRSLACLYYFENSWREGDGGETLISMHERCEGCKHDKLVAPLDNRLFIFECSPSSFHAFCQTKRTRHSLIFWLHSTMDDVATRWPLNEVVPW